MWKSGLIACGGIAVSTLFMLQICFAAETRANAKAVLDLSETDKVFESYALGVLDGIEIANVARKENDGPYCKPTDFRITVDQARKLTRDWMVQVKGREDLSLQIAMYSALLKTFPCK